jgi:hypothetical protein
VSEFDQPSGAIRVTKASMSAAVAGSSNAASTRACSCPSNSSSGAVHVVDVPASRAAFSTYACARSRDSGHAPTRFCQTRWASDRSASGCSERSRRTSCPHSDGISASTARRARTSSLRLVSCVDSVVIDSG